MQIHTEFIRGTDISYEFKIPSNHIEYNFVTPQPFHIDFKRGGSVNVAFARPRNVLTYEFSIGKQGPKGDEGDNGSLWHSGASTPSNNFGTDNDMYLNYTTYDLYQKIVTSWTLIGNIRGPQGPAGNGEGVLPVGGTVGQRLAKLSGTDFDVGWVTPADATHIHSESPAASVWNIAHPLSKFPSVTVVSAGGHVVVGNVQYIDEDNITLTFSGAFTGKAYLN